MPNNLEEIGNAPFTVNVIGGYKARNLGFIKYLYILGADSIVNTVNNDMLLTGQGDSTVVSEGLILKPNSAFNLILFPKKACTFSEVHQRTADGEEYVFSIEMTLPRTEPRVRNFIHLQNNRRFVVVMQDTNGFWYQVGDIDTPLTWRIETTVNTVNATKYVLGCKMWHPAWSLSDPMLYGIVPSNETPAQETPILGYDCKSEIEEIKRKLDNLSSSQLFMTEESIKTDPALKDNVYYKFSDGKNTYNIMGISNNDAVLLNRMKSGEIGIEKKSLRLSPVRNNQIEFFIPPDLNGYKIANFAVNHITYSEGEEYIVSETAGRRKIVWINTEFSLAKSDFIEISYYKIQSQF